MNRKLVKSIAIFLSVNMLMQLSAPTVAFALSGGPSQPEVESFEPVATTNMVDLFSGDFNYNIPLFDVGGYPINIAYHSGVGMDQEASWVGLGWNVNVGAINRNVRGVPDDFNGDEIVEENSYRDEITQSLFANFSMEKIGLDKDENALFRYWNNDLTEKVKEKKKQDSIQNANSQTTNNSWDLSFGLGVSNNNYRGLGLSFSMAVTTPSNISIGVGGGSQTGLNIDVSYARVNKDKKLAYTAGIGMNSRYGLNFIANPRWNTNKKGILAKAGQSILKSFPLGFNTAYQNGVPSSKVNTKETVHNYSIKMGGATQATFFSGALRGTHSKNTIEEGSKKRTTKSYGYMHAHNAVTGEHIMDFGKEREDGFQFETQNLPLTYNAFDIIQATGQGTSGIFRPHRDNIGNYSDIKATHTINHLGAVSGEVGFGSVLEVGITYSPAFGDRQYGPWGNNDLIENEAADLNFGYNQSNPIAEPFYFKAAGELTPVNETKYNNLAGDKAVMQKLNTKFFTDRRLTKKLVSSYLDDSDEIGTLQQNYAQDTRNIRAQYITYYNAEEAAQRMGIMDKLRSYFPGAYTQSSTAYQEINRLEQSSAKNHHIGEIVQTNPDGAKYYYSIPAYNNQSIEANFNSGNAPDAQRGLIGYQVNADGSTNYANGRDHFYHKTITPGYAHSYLLTAVLSPNYVDADGDGKPSDGDLGDYVLFNYTRVHESFRWRVPIEKNTGQFQDGLRSDPGDNRAAYSYGTKEIWYLHSIVTRNYIAEFKTSKRLDALGVEGEHGGADPSQFVNKLDSIYLFSKIDRIKNGKDAIPVKTVVFEYDYSLCPQVPNQVNVNTPFNNGKLTLKKLYFLYGTSKKGGETPYLFQYGYNPAYNLAAYDRWGNYKPNSFVVNNKDFPYVRQDVANDSSNAYASAWSLKKIILPSGGNILIDYEADDYAYVQDKKAMQMVTLVGATDSNGIKNFTPFNKNILYEDKNEINDHLVFNLPKGITTAEELKERCFKGIEYMYFKALVNIRGKQEYVSGWCKIDFNKIGLILGEPTYGYVRVLPIDDSRPYKKQHPISIAAFQFALARMNKVINPGSEPGGDIKQALRGLGNSLLEVADMFRSPYRKLRGMNVASKFLPNESWIRLNNANGFKIGGGVRVKKISFSDGWNAMDGTDNEMVFDQEFEYTTEENGRIISSGVAAYEPMVGGEENPLRYPIFSEVDKDLVRAELRLQEEAPFGESFFPAAGVGYSKVTVTANKLKTNAKNGTGYTVNHFYTAKDFPVKIDDTQIRKRQLGHDPLGSRLISLLKYVSVNRLLGSQGYAIKVNDMHGKPKGIDVYGAKNGNSAPKISSVKYYYKTDNNGELDNYVKVLNENGSIETKLVGKEVDVSLYSASNFSKNVNVRLPINLKFTFPGFGIAFFWPGFNYERSVNKYATITKLIQVNGILEKTVVEDENSIIATSNLIFDKYTGGVLLTQTTNNFDDPIYNFNYPAYLAYDNMGASYKNQDIKFDLTTNASGVSDSEYNQALFTIGDQLHLTSTVNNVSSKAWVYQIVPVANTANVKIMVIAHNGTPLTGSFKGKLVQSGRKNMLNHSVGGLVLSASPVQGNSIVIPNSEVIQASAVTYNHQWPMSNLIKLGTGQQVCEKAVSPYIIETFAHINEILSRNIQNNSAIRYWLESHPNDFPNTPIGQTLNQFNFCTDKRGFEHFIFRSPSSNTNISNLDSVFSWQDLDNDTVYLYLTNPFCANGFASRLQILSNGCKLIDVDRFLTPQINQSNLCGTLNVKAVMNNNDTCNFEILANSGIYDNCFAPNVNCQTIYTCTYSTGGNYNPFITGDKNMWLQQSELAFNEERIYPFKGDTTFIRKDGKIKNFTPYWLFNNTKVLTHTSDKRWIAANSITRYNKRLQPIEQVDALNNYSAELYGYNESFVTATGSYTRLNEIASDNFEEYVSILPNCETVEHWNFKSGNIYSLSNQINTPIEQDGWNITEPTITNKFSHTGKQSLCVPAKRSVGVKTFTDSLVVDKVSPFYNTFYESSVVKKQQVFSPFKQGKYVVSAWVMGRAKDRDLINAYDSAYVRVVVTDANNATLMNVVMKPSGPMIEGWQRIEGMVTIPTQAKYIEVVVENIGRYRAYFDDIRIHPFASNMRTFVYDPVHLKVMAVLDENNFASFYEYDNEGKLIRIKKETEKGVFTIKESRNGMRKPLIP